MRHRPKTKQQTLSLAEWHAKIEKYEKVAIRFYDPCHMLATHPAVRFFAIGPPLNFESVAQQPALDSLALA